MHVINVVVMQRVLDNKTGNVSYEKYMNFERLNYTEAAKLCRMFSESKTFIAYTYTVDVLDRTAREVDADIELTAKNIMKKYNEKFKEERG